MLPSSPEPQNKETNNYLNVFDKLLSDKYILAKEIRDLNKTLQDSDNQLSELESEMKNKLILKEQLDKYINLIDEIEKESGNVNDSQIDLLRDVEIPETDKNILFQHNIEELIEKFNSNHELHKSLKILKIEKSEFVQVKQLMINNIVTLTDEIMILQEKIVNRNNANSEVRIESDGLKVQLKNIEEEIARFKSIED